MKINENYLDLSESYLFSTVAAKVGEYRRNHKDAEVISLGIGDVTRPLPQSVVEAMCAAAREMGDAATFRGYGPEQGYGFLQTAIKNYYTERKIVLDEGEIFVSDGAKSDLGNILDIFSCEAVALVTDPVYPVYVDTNLMAGRKVVKIVADEKNDFLPLPDYSINADLIYLCSPNNPTGAAYDETQLTAWVNYAKTKGAVILFDAAYEYFITEDLPHSIYEIDGAKDCAIEFCSLSKTAGFTGVRCGYTVVPYSLESKGLKLNKMWLRRQTTKFNGVSYVTQRGAAAVFAPEGRREIEENISVYRGNAKILSDVLDELGIYYVGGKNSPYIFMKCPHGMTSWQFFDELLAKTGVVGTPGSGFGRGGEGFFRLSAFNTREKTLQAAEKIKKLLQ